MKVGFMGTILKQNSNRPSGSVHHHPDRRKRGKWKTMWSQCWSAFSKFTRLSIRNSSLQVRPSMRSSTATSWGGLGRTWDGSGQTNGARTTGCSITTMRPRTPLLLCSNIWPRKTWRSSRTLPRPSYSPDLAPCDFFLFPKMKIKLKGRIFDTVEEI
jgi:hypothetical protein